MKTTLDLPNDLVREIKLRAVNDGRKLKDTMADLLRKGLRARTSRRALKSGRVQLPLVQCRRVGDLTPDQVSIALQEQEAAWHREASRH
jgi:plasmid stability protein